MAIKNRKTCASDDLDYKSIINKCDTIEKAIRQERKSPITDSRRWQIKVHIHTLMLIKWLAKKRFGVETESIADKLRKYYCAVHTNLIDELFLLKTYQFGTEDLEKYINNFKEETRYEVEKI